MISDHAVVVGVAFRYSTCALIAVSRGSAAERGFVIDCHRVVYYQLICIGVALKGCAGCLSRCEESTVDRDIADTIMRSGSECEVGAESR